MARKVTKGAAEHKLDGYEYIGCRLRRHQWDENGVYLVREGRQKWIAFKFTCMSCGCERTDIYDQSAELVERTYKHAKGYLLRYTDDERRQGIRVTTRTAAAVLVHRALSEGVPELPVEE